MAYEVECEHENCHHARIPGGRRLHRYLHDNVSWYRDWHHHPIRPHLHVGTIIAAVIVAGAVVFSPGTTGLQAEVGGYPISGRLLDSSNRPVFDGTHEIVFRLYPVEQGGTAVWTEIHDDENRVLTSDGYYTVELGRLTRLDHINLAEDQYYLGISVDGKPEFAPRWPIGEIPFQPLGE